MLQKAEKCRFYQEIGGRYKGTIILKNSVPIRSISFKCVFVRLEKALMRGKNEREIPLALYNRLQYKSFANKIAIHVSGAIRKPFRPGPTRPGCSATENGKSLGFRIKKLSEVLY